MTSLVRKKNWPPEPSPWKRTWPLTLDLHPQHAGCHRIFSSPLSHIYLHKQSSSQQRRNFFSRRQRDVSHNIVLPAAVSPAHPVPKHIKKPDYVTTGIMPDWGDSIEVKNEDQIQGLRQACQLARHILLLAGKSLKVDMTTEEIDALVHHEIISHNAYPSPLGYGRFPKSVCTSVNNVLCHGIPDSRPLRDGDIINIDVTVYYNGYHGDTSETFLVGNVDECGKKLVAVARRCRDEAIAACGAGAPFSVIGNTISQKFHQDPESKLWRENALKYHQLFSNCTASFLRRNERYDGGGIQRVFRVCFLPLLSLEIKMKIAIVRHI
ncbi:methionine aminopeptidase 1D, mitochondrial isoform X4 [Nannospalax galili]|uniref:methionine aminopeptidase 1D, mitochondrial isoform X4 n=1 Tax=Nannospalax galili TaxID=1026970 RepID=UPI00111BD03D|nr:methionine aminopeptidase 1D, mitochondrial isoform X4 [Nannospalax galili]